MQVTNTPTGSYTHLPNRNILAELARADVIARRNLKRGYPLLPRQPAPVFGLPANSLMERVKQYVRDRLANGNHATITLYHAGPSDHQCRKFNAGIEAIARAGSTGGRLQINYVNKEDFL